MTDVAVVIPVLDRERTLESAIRSALACDPPPTELVVVDCGSSDGSVEVARGFGDRVRVLEVPGANAGTARNAGAASSRAPLLGFLDSDDEALPAKTGGLSESIEADPSTVLVHGMVQVIDENGAPLPEDTARLKTQQDRATTWGTSYEALAGMCSMYTSATLISRSAFEAVGGYDETLDVYEDWDLYLRLSRVGGLTYADVPAARYRRWGGNVPWDRTARGTIEVARKHLATLAGDADGARFGFQVRLAGSHYTLLEVTEARAAALEALRLDPRRAFASAEVRRALTRWLLPRGILQRRRPPRTET
jgi:hypothetical protein